MTEIEIVGIPGRTSARLDATRRLRALLQPIGRAARRCRLAFRDENGPKGGVAVRCTVDLTLQRRRPIHVDARATSAALALAEALDRLQRRTERVVGALRDAGRHPKKYFVAARALTGGGTR
jgi:hypothetical protein